MFQEQQPLAEERLRIEERERPLILRLSCNLLRFPAILPRIPRISRIGSRIAFELGAYEFIAIGLYKAFN